MYSIVECGGFQFKVSEGDEVKVPLLDLEKDAELTLDKVLLTVDGEITKVGMPTVAGATVTAKVIEHAQAKKILVMKKLRRKDYRRKNGHRQQYTKIKILSVKG